MPRPLKDQYMGFLDYLFGVKFVGSPTLEMKMQNNYTIVLIKKTDFDLYKLENN